MEYSWDSTRDSLCRSLRLTRAEPSLRTLRESSVICSGGDASVGKRVKMIREVIREIVGFTNYEKRMMEMIKIGTGAAAKKALALVRKRLGSMKRAKAKQVELEEVVQTMRHAAEHHEHKEEPKKEEGKKA